jgi:amino acid adenylation domain-containing protein
MTTPITTGFALSPLQQRLWQLGERDGHAAYRVELAFDAAPPVTDAQLRAAFARVAARHQILRTVFGALPEVALPVQSPLAQPLPLAADPAAMEQAGAIVLQPLGGGRSRLLLSALCGDAATALRLLQWLEDELATPSPAAPVQEALAFSSLAQWQHEMLAEAAAGADLPQWPAAPPTALPFQRRVGLGGTRPARHRVALDAALQQAVQRLAASQGCGVDAVLLAAWAALLLRLHGERVPIAALADGRSYEEMAALPGPFARFAPLPLHADAAQAFAELVRAAASARDGLRQVQDAVAPLPPQRHPVVGFAWTEALAGGRGLLRPGTPWAWTDRCTVLLAAHAQQDGTLDLHFDHDAPACEDGALARLEEEFVTLLASATRDPQQTLARLAILGPRERRLVLEDFQGELVPPHQPWQAAPSVIAGVLAASDHVVVEQPGLALDGPTFAARVDALALRLARAGVRRGAIVGLLLPRGIDLVAGLLAIQRAGAAYLPLDTGYPQERLAFMLRDSGAALLLTSQALAAQLPATPAFAALLDALEVMAVDAQHADHGGPAAPWPELGPQDLAFVIYTSGSTGRPKGVRVPHGALANHMQWMLRELPLTPADAVLQKTAISFDASVWEIFAPLMAGARLVLAPAGAERDPELLADTVERHGITVLQTVPSLLRLLVHNPRFAACRTLRRLCCGGEPLDADLAQRALALGPELVNLYGPTETTIQVVMERVAGEPVVAIGRPIDNTRIYVLDPDGQPVPVGVRGELYIAGASLAQGYHGRADLTAQRFVADPFAASAGARMYRSGDLGAWRADGRLDCFGRGDRQVKLRGFRIELGEVEAVAAAQPGVAQVCVLVDRDQAGIDQLLCFAAPQPGRRVEAAALKEALARALPDYMTPNWVVPVDGFPTTPNGKVDTAALLRLRPSSASGAKGPRDQIEMRLERIWTDVLNVRHAGVDNSFFDLGGHSLLAVRLMAEIEQEFGHRLPLTSLFTAPTIAAQAALLRGQPLRVDPMIVPIRSGRSGHSPVVLVHPTGGSVLCYRDLAARIRTERAVIALQDPGLSTEATYDTVEELATTYLDRLEPLVPDRRYLLAGWSSGGVIAYEIARQALARGHEVALLCLIDSRHVAPEGAPAAPPRERLVRSVSRLIAHKGAVQCPDLSGLPFEQALQRLLQLAREADFLPADAGGADIARLFSVFERNVAVVSRYRAKPLPRRTLILKATQALPESIREAAVGPATDSAATGWEDLCFATVRPIDADHLSMMEQPRLAGVVAALDGELAEVERLHALGRQNLMPLLGL